jgi:hypothetical protein
MVENQLLHLPGVADSIVYGAETGALNDTIPHLRDPLDSALGHTGLVARF